MLLTIARSAFRAVSRAWRWLRESPPAPIALAEVAAARADRDRRECALMEAAMRSDPDGWWSASVADDLLLMARRQAASCPRPH